MTVLVIAGVYLDGRYIGFYPVGGSCFAQSLTNQLLPVSRKSVTCSIS